MRRVAVIARADLRRAVRERRLWGAVLLIAVLFLPGAITAANPELRPLSEYVLLTGADIRRYVVVVAAGVSYHAILRERTTGTAKLVTGLGATRREFVAGMCLSRSIIVAAVVSVTLVVANGAALVNYGEANLAAFWTMGVLVILYGLVWTAITVGYSAMFASSYRVLAAVTVTYLAFNARYGFWDTFVRPVVSVVVAGTWTIPGYEVLPAAPLWVRFVQRLNPLIDFWQALRWSVGTVRPGPVAGTFPWQVLGLGVFVVFGAVPLAAGLRRFDGGRMETSHPDGGLLATLRTHLRVAETRVVPTVGWWGPRATLATHDLRRAVRGWTVPALVVASVLVVPGLVQTLRPAGPSSTATLIAGIGQRFVLPALVLSTAVGFRAVVRERRTGTIRLVFGHPVSRRELLVSKFVSRSVVVVATLVPLLVSTQLLVLVRFENAHLVAFAAWAGWVAAFAVVWTVFVVAISASVSSQYRSLAVVLAVFASLSQLWETVLSRPGQGPIWIRLLDQLNPLVSLNTLREGAMVAAGYRTAFTTVTPLTVLVSLTVVAGAVALSVAVGLRRFERADLG